MLVAGGSGIVPLMAMIRHWAALGDRARSACCPRARSPDDVIYAAELERLAAAGDGLRDVITTLTRSQPAGLGRRGGPGDPDDAGAGCLAAPSSGRSRSSAGRPASSRRLPVDWSSGGTSPPDADGALRADGGTGWMSDDLRLDGNAAAGALQELFGFEVTVRAAAGATAAAPSSRSVR